MSEKEHNHSDEQPEEEVESTPKAEKKERVDEEPESLNLPKMDPNKLVTVSAYIFDPVLKNLQKMVTAQKIGRYQRVMEKVGHAVIPLIGLVMLVLGLIISISLRTWTVFPITIAATVMLLLGQYLSANLLGSLRSLVKQSPGQVGTANFLNCLGLLTFIVGVVAFLLGTLAAIFLESFTAFLVGLGILVLAEFKAGIAVNPKVVNVHVDPDSTPGQEALGLIGFFVKSTVALVPIAYGAGLLIALIDVSVGGMQVLFAEDYEKFAGLTSFLKGIVFAVFCSLLPLFVYVFYMVYYITIDFIQAVLSLPGKLDKLRE